jgi:hypothetical protein
MSKKLIAIFIAVFLFSFSFNFAGDEATATSSLPVFPGAVGWGSDTVAGSGRHLYPVSTTVHKVTNLNESGPGTLKACVQASGPRVCVFEVSGTIELTESLEINNPYLTIAGQTAPDPGIMLKNTSLRIDGAGGAHDILVQHITVRTGDDDQSKDWDTFIATQGAYNILLDHVSFSWGIDEVFDFVYSTHHATVMNSIISEGLHCSHHSKGCHSRGAMGSRAHHTGFINNIIAHNYTRSPNFGKSTNSEPTNSVVVNNVIYNWGFEGTQITNSTGGTGNKHISVVGNVYQTGPDTRVGGNGNFAMVVDDYPGNEAYIDDNMLDGVVPADPWDIVDGNGAPIRVNSPPVVNGETLWPSGLVAQDVTTVYNSVLANAGSRPASRDTVDARIVNEVMTGTGSIIDSQDDVGGYPVYAQNYRALTLPTNPNGDDDGDGYTNLEEWLFDFSAQVEGASGQPVASAGPDQTVSDSDGDGIESINLDGSASHDPDGEIVAYDWSESGVPIANGVTTTLDFIIGAHPVTLKVTDDSGATSTDDVLITVLPNQAPVADAGPDQEIVDQDGDGFELVALDGSGSSDDGTVVSYEWYEGANLVATGVNPTLNLALGSYTYDLVVTDNLGLTASDSVLIEVTQEQFTLSAVGYKVKGKQKADLTWSGANSVNVDVFRDSALVATVANDGFYTDNINKKGGGSYLYQLCEEGTATCSNTALVAF